MPGSITAYDTIGGLDYPRLAYGQRHARDQANLPKRSHLAMANHDPNPATTRPPQRLANRLPRRLLPSVRLIGRPGQRHRYRLCVLRQHANRMGPHHPTKCLHRPRQPLGGVHEI